MWPYRGRAIAVDLLNGAGAPRDNNALGQTAVAILDVASQSGDYAAIKLEIL